MADASSLKLNLTDSCHTVPSQYHGWGMLGRRAGLTVSVYAQVQYTAESPKQHSKRLNSRGRQIFLPIWVYNLSMVWNKSFLNNPVYSIVICMVDNLAAAAALSAVGYGNILKWGSRDNTKSLPGIYIYLCILYNMYMYWTAFLKNRTFQTVYTHTELYIESIFV